MTESFNPSEPIDDRIEAGGSEAADPVAHARRLEAVGHLAGGIAHDFSNLLQVIGGYADVLQACVADGSVDLGRLARASQAIRAATDQAAGLARKLHDISRDPASVGRAINLNAVVEGMQSEIEQAVGDTIVLNTALDPRLDAALVDPSDLRTALSAVLINAREATSNGGRIDVRTENVSLADRQAAMLHGVSAGRYVAVSVSDTGCGMPPENVVRATEPFFSTKEPGRARGLGLALVDCFARRSNGTVKIRSAVGSGTTVRLLFPARAEAGASPEHEVSG